MASSEGGGGTCPSGPPLGSDTGRSPLFYIPSFVEIFPLVPGKKKFKWFLPYMGMVAILVMSPASCSYFFISMYPKAYIQSLKVG